MTDADVRARDAEALLGNPLLAEVLDGIEVEATEAWTRSRPDDSAGRERLYVRLTEARRIRDKIKAVVDDAKFARPRASLP